MLADLLQKEKATVVKKWFAQVLDSYPEDTSRFLKSEKSPFANPVGSAIREGIEGIYDALLEEDAPAASLGPFLDKLIRIRAVQDFSPSQAISFVFSLKKVVRKLLKKDLRNPKIQDELTAFDDRIDRLSLLAFDHFVACREEVYELRIRELRGHRDAAVRMLERNNEASEKIQQGEKP
jgi:hypothetical protein